MPIKKLLFICFISCWLASCASLPSNQPPAQDQKQDKSTRAKDLTSIKNWNLKALIAVKNPKEGDWTANLQWAQKPQYYSILLFGPLGSNSVKLTGGPGNAKLETADGKVFNAASPELLLAQQTGWDLPVSSLYYWIRGLPVPNVTAQKQFDTYNHLTVLQQQGWYIQYLRYTSVNNIDVPNKIFLSNPALNVKIVISEWNI